jgi:hypothetical protein
MDDVKAIVTYTVRSNDKSVLKSKSFSYAGFEGRGNIEFRANVVFAGYGIQDPEAGYDDYATMNVKGKIVFLLLGQPAGVKLTRPVSGAQKVVTAYQHGAVACFIYQPSGSEYDWGSTDIGLAGPIADFPCIVVDGSIASELLAGTGVNVTKVDHKPHVGAEGIAVTLKMPPVCDPKRPTFNVLAKIPGTDPKLSGEVVMIGAHYDHLGDDGKGHIFRGADDNASGTSVVVEVARAIERSGLRPRRTIVFASWTGEEAGLVGSNYFAANPPFPLTDIVSNIEMDMVGVGMTGHFMTTGASAYPNHYRHLNSSAHDLGYTLTADRIRGASDHLAFTRKCVPTSLLYVDGFHPNYHTCGDVPSGINRKALECTARLAALSIWRAANA